MPYLLAAYVIAIAAGFIYFNLRLTVEWVAIILFIAAVLSGRGLLFVRDWGVFIVVLLGWQVASGLATNFKFPWHLTDPLSAEKLLFFGTVPSVWLQQHLYHPGTLEPWDVMAAALYLLHFLAPLLAGFALWMTNRALFRKFAITIVIVALAGFATYIFYPAVPPWLASYRLIQVHGEYVQPWIYQSAQWIVDAPRGTVVFHPGHWIVNVHRGTIYLPGVTNLFDVIAGHWYNPYHGTIFFPFLHQVHYDPVGAIPSEHAAYPFLFFLFLLKQFGKRAYLVLIYLGAILFAITYLGQHYIVDAIIGFAYAGAGYVLVMHVWPIALRQWQFRRAEYPRARGALAPELEEA